MARRATERKLQVGLYLTQSQADWLRDEAERRGVAQSHLVAAMIAQAREQVAA